MSYRLGNETVNAPVAFTFSELAGFSDEDLSRLVGETPIDSIYSFSGLGAAKKKVTLKTLFDNAKKAMQTPAFLRNVSNFVKGAATVFKLAAGAISAIYPPAAVVLGPVTKLIEAGEKGVAVIEAAKKKVTDEIAKAKRAQAAVASIVQDVKKQTDAAAAEGRPVPASVTITPEAIEKRMMNQSVISSPAPPGPAPESVKASDVVAAEASKEATKVNKPESPKESRADALQSKLNASDPTKTALYAHKVIR